MLNTIQNVPDDISNVHAQFCCNIHGCRWDNTTCPVVQKNIIQLHPCGESSICSEYEYHERYKRNRGKIQLSN